MADFWSECYDPRIALTSGQPTTPETFSQSFCRLCRNQECSRSGGSGSKWLQRMSTQEDRLLLHPRFADPDDPRFKHLREIDFPSALREAMRIEIADRRGDWVPPTEQDALLLAAEMSTRVGPSQPTVPIPEDDEVPPLIEEDDAPVGKVLREYSLRGSGSEVYRVTEEERIVGRSEWFCTCKAFEFGRARPCKHITYAMSLPPEDAPEPTPPTAPVPSRFQAPPKATPPAKQPEAVKATAKQPEVIAPPAKMPDPPRVAGRPFLPTVGNIPVPSGGIMIDGSPPPSPRERGVPSQGTAAADPWAAPTQKKKVDNVVPVGARVVLGGKGSKS